MTTKRKAIPPATRQKVYEKYNGCCAYCGISLEYKDMQVDHLHPVQKGGSNELENLMPACCTCTHPMNDFAPVDYDAPVCSLYEPENAPD